MDTQPRYSVIIPVYNRPNEMEELLESLTRQTVKNFEVVVIEDGSSIPCKEIIDKYSNQIKIYYFVKPNTGRSDTRNFGMKHANGTYFIFFDSDCIIPPHYFETVENYLAKNPTDCFGGPDDAHPSFSPLQKAISYSMTSFLTTGGIRGGKHQMEKFVPRSFNMGFTRQVFETVGGFLDMFGEDIDLSNRIKEARFSCTLIGQAYVYHKRRINLRSFYRQVNIFGQARIDVTLRFPRSLKAVHTLPALFVLGYIGSITLSILLSPLFLLPLAIFYLLITLESLVRFHSIKISLLSLVTSTIQLVGYGLGFLDAFVKKIILRQSIDPEKELEKHYKKKA